MGIGDGSSACVGKTIYHIIIDMEKHGSRTEMMSDTPPYLSNHPTGRQT